MSKAFLITIPLMLLAIVVAVAPVLVMSIREQRISKGRRSRSEESAPRGTAKNSPSLGGPGGDARATVVVLEEAAIAVNRLRARPEFTAGAEVHELDEMDETPTAGSRMIRPAPTVRLRPLRTSNESGNAGAEKAIRHRDQGVFSTCCGDNNVGNLKR